MRPGPIDSPDAAPRDAVDPDEHRDQDYEPPTSPDEDHPLSLVIKVAVAMVLAQWLATRAGFESPTWSVLSAAFLATSPPVASAAAAGRKVLATLVGVALGAAGAYAAQAMEGAVLVHVGLVGVVVGLLGNRSPDYLFAAIVAMVVTFTGVGGDDPLAEVVVGTTCMILIGCAVGPPVVFVVERVKRALWRRRRRGHGARHRSSEAPS